jgi:hypothetical protein
MFSELIESCLKSKNIICLIFLYVLSCLVLFSPVKFIWSQLSCRELPGPVWYRLVLSCLVGFSNLTWSHLSCWSWLFLSGHVLSYLVLSCLVLSCPVWSFLVLSGRVWSCLVLSGPILPCLVLFSPIWSCLALSGPILPYLVLFSPIWSCLALSGPIGPCLVLHVWSYLVRKESENRHFFARARDPNYTIHIPSNGLHLTCSMVCNIKHGNCFNLLVQLT